MKQKICRKQIFDIFFLRILRWFQVKFYEIFQILSPKSPKNFMYSKNAISRTDQFLRVMQPFSFLKFWPLQLQFRIDQFLIKNVHGLCSPSFLLKKSVNSELLSGLIRPPPTPIYYDWPPPSQKERKEETKLKFLKICRHPIRPPYSGFIS